MNPTVEKILSDYGQENPGAEVSFVDEEFVTVHGSVFSGNVCEASIQATMTLPDGSEWECEEKVRICFRRVRQAPPAHRTAA